MAKRQIIIILLFLLSFIAAQAQITPNLYSSVDEDAMYHWVDSVFDSMSEEECIGQFFMIVADPTTDTKNMARLVHLVNEQKIGGILFQKGDPESQVKVTNRMQREARIPLLIALDGEWGLSMRLSGTTRFPKNMMLGAISDLDLIEQYGEEVGRQCREMGIHVNFAPTVDVNSNAKNPVIGIRSFGEDPGDVARRAIVYSRGLEKAGIMAVAKHFPGHGDTKNDSHHLLPVINHDFERLKEVELYPFNRYIRSGFDGIMIAHLDVPALGTNGHPSSFSREVVTELLRDQMGFRGLCFTDGLAMKGAITRNNESICVLALKAGNDILVGPVNPEKEFEAVKQAVKRKELSMSDLNRRCRRILCYKYIAGLNNFSPISTNNLNERLNTPHAEWLNAKLNAEAITIVKNNNDLLPLKQLNKKRIAAISMGSRSNNDFHIMLKKYGEVDCYNISSNADYNDKKSIYDKLKNYDVIICSIHNTKMEDSRELQNIASGKELIFVFFTVPYTCSNFNASAGNAQSIVIAYESTDLAEKYAAQAIFGGIPAKGSLSVSIPNMFTAGTGIHTEKTRLGFHEPEEVHINPYKLQAIDAIAYEGLDKEAYPGCRIIVAKDGMIIYNKSFGYYDYSKKKEVSENTVYDLASASKATGTLLALMRSYDNGNYQLTNKISDFVTELKGSDKKDIIIRDLLYHQSGLPSTIAFYEKAIDKSSYSGSLYSSKKDNNHPLQFDSRTYVNTNFKYNPNIVSRNRKEGFKTEVARNLYVSDAFVKDSIISGIVNAKMGTSDKYNYSCINFILLQKMVEKQENKQMDRLLDEYFFKRIGTSAMTYNPLRKMDSTQIAPSEKDQFLRHQVVRGYVHDEAAAFQGGVSGNAGLFSNAEDLAKIAQLYLNNGIYGDERYISTKTCTLFTGSKSPISRRGLGFDKPDTKNPPKSPCGLLTPQSVYGHTGFTGTCFWIDPDNNLFFIFLSNRTFPSRTNTKLFSLDIRTRIQDAIYKALE
ncbi:MAG: serine hydrolase [Tannerella sp.]|jgi:beta-glucosidase-like glycosyl hydrolase/CubicO group peptidase (beta-lactamase class C family)|nr:serine hydrolase [Tannerella sp.]